MPTSLGSEVEFGYTLGWDLITAHDENGTPRGRAVCYAPDRALIVLDERNAPPRFEGTLRFPEASGLGPVRARQVGAVSRHVAGDHIAMVEIFGTSLGLARLQLAWLRERVRKSEALLPQTRHIELESIHDRARIDRILAMLRTTGAAVTVRGSGDSNGPTLRGRIDRDGALLLQWDRALRITPPLRVTACGYNSVYELVWPDSAGFTASTQEIVRIRRRRHRRVAAPSRLRVTFRHPMWPQLSADRPVVDLSREGLSFTTDSAQDGLFPGLTLPITVAWKRGVELHFEATVRHATPRGRGMTDLCGVSLRPLDARTEARWDAEIDALLHPRTERFPPSREQWALYEESGYFRLSGKTSVAFSPLRTAFEAQRAQLVAHPEVAAHFGLRSAGRLQAVMSQIEAWDGGWLLFQVARRAEERPLAGAGDDVLRDLYMHAYEHVLHRPEARHLVTYVQDVARFSRRCQHELGARLADAGVATVTPFRAIEMRCNAVFGLQPPPGVVISRADRCERELASRWLARHRPALYRAGTGLDDRRLELGGVDVRWRRAGLRRTREVLVVRDRGVTEAAMVLDGADAGLHLFGLLDVARFIPLCEHARTYLPLLLQTAARWYGAANKRSFVYFEEYTPLDRVMHPGATDLGLAYCVVVPIRLLAEQLEHVFEITAPTS